MLQDRGGGRTHAVGPVCAWFVEEGMTQDTTGVSIELIDTGWLAVKADLLVEESVSVSSVKTYVLESTSRRSRTGSQLWSSLA